ncbi:MAG TPA: YbaY family lipoprotein [Rubrivivax sp.]|nr:YbaY family lipoprotein [Rubrivivax sp.]
MSFTPVAALAALAVLLAACGTQPPVSTLSIRGQLAVPGRVELPPDAQMVVELRDETTDRVLAEQRQPLREISSPQPFDLQLPRDKLVPGQQLKLRGALLMQGWAQWLSAPLAIDPGQADIDIGTLSLTRAARPLAFQSTLDCGGRRFIVGMAGDTMRLLDGEMAHDLQAAPAASDSRLEAVGDSSTYVWADGSRATVSVRGVVFRGCTVQRGAGAG